jgi:hypothetical protein
MSERENNYYYKQSDDKLKESIQWLLSSDFYFADDFTRMIKDIIKRNKLTEKQRNVLIKHLIKHQVTI